MKKKFFMIIAIMIIVTMAVVGLAACIDNNGGGNNGGSDNGDNNNGSGNIDNNGGNTDNGGGVEEVTPITETAGININNFRTELEKKNFTLKSEITRKNDDVTEAKSSTLEYEPTKWKETEVINGENAISYLYQLDDKNVLVEADLSIRFIVNDVLSNVVYCIAPNVSDLFDFKDSIYTVKKDKYAEYYKAMKNDTEAETTGAEWEAFKTMYNSLKIQFKEHSISLSYSISFGNDSESYSFEITKIGSTSVTIPQEILDLPLPGDESNAETAGLNINNFHTELEKKNFTLKNELTAKYGGVTETQVRILEYEPMKFKETLFYNDENYSRYFYKLGDKNVIVEMDLSVSFTSDIAISSLVDVIVPNVDLYVLKDGVYTVKKNKFEDFYKAVYHDNEIPTGNVWGAYSSFFASIKIQFKEDSILISYAKSSNESYILEITQIGSTVVTIPQEILDLPLPGDESFAETEKLNVNNFRSELGNKNFTLKKEVTVKFQGGTLTEGSTLEYEPTKWKETEVIDGKNYARYLYQLGNKNVLIESDLSISFIENNVLSNVVYCIAPNEDLFDYKAGVYTVKKDKFAEYYKAMKDNDASLEDPEFEILKTVYNSLIIQFKRNSILLSYTIQTDDASWSYSFEITKIGTTSVTIPQEILDIPVHGVKINNTNSLYGVNYTATLKEEVNGVVTESELKFCNDNYEPRLAFYIKGEADIRVYAWEEFINGQMEYFIATRENDEFIKEYAFRDDLYVIVDMLNGIVGRHEFFELKEGKYVIKENSIEDYINSYNLKDEFGNDLDAARAYVSSIEYFIGKDTITLSYEKTIYSETTKTTLTISDFHTTTTSIPNSIKNLPITIA